MNSSDADSTLVCVRLIMPTLCVVGYYTMEGIQDSTLVPSITADGTSHHIFTRTTFTQQVFLDHWACCNVPDQISVPAIMLYIETSQIFDKFLTQVYTEDLFL